MYDLNAIEAINIDQLVTATDRLLLRAHRMRRLQTRRSFDLSREAALAVAVSKARSKDDAEKTVYMRAQPITRELFGAAAVVAGTAWLCVTVACLLS